MACRVSFGVAAQDFDFIDTDMRFEDNLGNNGGIEAESMVAS